MKIVQEELPALNLTPMIDIVFLLIIFFMVGTKFTELERKIALDVPRISDAGPLAPAPSKRVINVHRNGTIELDGERLDLQQLTARLAAAREEYADTGVIVRGDADGAFQNVAEVLGACRRAGISELGITVRVAGGSRRAYR